MFNIVSSLVLKLIIKRKFNPYDHMLRMQTLFFPMQNKIKNYCKVMYEFSSKLFMFNIVIL